MALASPHPPRLQSKGALRPDSLYVERQADATLCRALVDNEFCYVLAPRQIGKSSLRFHTARKLEREHGTSCVHLDLNALGMADGKSGRERWYFALLQKIADDLKLEDPLPFYQGTRGELPPVQRFRRYLREIVLSRSSRPVVIFVDEIDYVRKLGFDSDEFFAAVRAIYNDRAGDSGLGRLAFCLLGVASPHDLIKDPNITPFNVGRDVHLRDFTRREVEAFAPLLASLGGPTAAWLDAIYGWTAGHPYMTHALCEQLQQNVRAFPLASTESHYLAGRVDAVVRRCFLLLGRAEDPCLSYAEARLVAHPRRADLLALYRRLLLGEREPARVDDAVQIELGLCGMSAVHVGPAGAQSLRVRNRIFEKVFNYDWAHGQEVAHLWSEALRKWQLSGKRRDALLRGTELDLAEEWAHEHVDEVSPEENEFLLASVEEARRQSEAKAAAERARRQRRIIGMLVWALALTMLLLVVIGSQYREARQREAAARQAAKAERQAREAAERRANAEPPVPSPGGLPAQPPELEMIVCRGHTGSILSVSFSPDGQRLLTAGSDGTLRLWEVASGRQQLLMRPPGGALIGAWLAAGGSGIVAATSDGYVELFDEPWRAHGPPPRRLLHSPAPLLFAVPAPDGTRLCTASSDGVTRVWDVEHGRVLARLDGHDDAVVDARFSPDGSRVVTGSRDGTARLWDARSGQRLRILGDPGSAVLAVAFSADGTRVATADEDGTAAIWDAASGVRVVTLDGTHAAGAAIAFSPDGQQVAIGASDGTASLWDTGSGQQRLRLTGHDGALTAAGFSPDGKYVYTAGRDGALRLWRVALGDGRREVTESRLPPEPAPHGAVGQALAASPP